MEYTAILSRYIGREVCVSTFGHIRLRGELAAIYEDCVRLINTSSAHDQDDGPWSKSLSDPCDQSHLERGEALVHFNHIVAIRCGDEDLMDVPVLPAMEMESNASQMSPASIPVDFEAPQEPHDAFLEMDRLTLEVGARLVPLIHPEHADIMDRISAVRCHLADSMGVVIPRLRLRDSLDLADQEYRILIDQCEVARGKLGPGLYIALDMGESSAPLKGVHGNDPTFGGPGIWIPAERQHEAEQLGYLVIDPVMLIITHFQETLRRHIHEVVTLSDVQDLIERSRMRSSASFDDSMLVTAIRLPLVHAVLRRLLEEGESIKNFPRILEVLSLHAKQTGDIESFVQLVRVRLGRQLIQRFLDCDGKIHAIGLDRELESHIADLKESTDGVRARDWLETMADLLEESFQHLEDQQRPTAMIVPTHIRSKLWQIFSARMPQLTVLALSEIPRGIEICWELFVTADDVGACRIPVKKIAEEDEVLSDDFASRRPR